MTAKDLMTPDPACCTKDASLQELARLMVRHNCGAIPIVDSQERPTPVGMVTDRDIVCRAIAEGKNPLELEAAALMSSPVVTVRESDAEDVVRLSMESHQLRRIPVVDEYGAIRGIIAVADLARTDSKKQTGEVVREVSTPAPRSPSRESTRVLVVDRNHLVD